MGEDVREEQMAGESKLREVGLDSLGWYWTYFRK